MFQLLRYGLIPVVIFCGVVLAASVDAYSTNAGRASAWRQTTATVVASQDFGDVAAQLQGKPNTFPDPYGTVEYAVDGKTYAWRGRGRDIGVTVMRPGDRIKVYYDPKNPRDISTLVMLGAFTGNIIAAVAAAFVVFYAWFFWLRGLPGRSGPTDSDGAIAELRHEVEPPNTPAPAPMTKAAATKRGNRGRAVSFGKR